MQPDRSTIPGRGPTIVACSECGALFRTFPSQGKTSCSPTCRGHRLTRLAHARNSRPCVVCGTSFYAAPGAFENEGRQACGMACRNVLLSRMASTRGGSPIERFWSLVTKTDGCWERGGARLHFGHVAFTVEREQERAHRFAWMLATGDVLTPDDVIGHTCDNPPCVRNDEPGTYEVRGVALPRRGHLFKGTQGDNVADMIAKGRHRHGGK